MLNINNIRKEFAAHLGSQPGARFSMDAALMHVVQLAYQAGLDDGQAQHPAAVQPPSTFKAEP